MRYFLALLQACLISDVVHSPEHKHYSFADYLTGAIKSSVTISLVATAARLMNYQILQFEISDTGSGNDLGAGNISGNLTDNNVGNTNGDKSLILTIRL